MELKLLMLACRVPKCRKSTFLSIVTSAKPKIANYHFTTLVPNLGVVDLGSGRSFVIADIPGLIEGAHSGVGLGHDFLRHVERTKVLIHLLDTSGLEGRDPLEDFDKINQELKLYSEKLANKPQLVACNKMDIPEARENYGRIAEELGKKGYEVYAISAATRDGIAPIMDRVFNLLESIKDVEEPVEEIVDLMYHISTEDKPFTARKENGVFIVEGS